MKQNAYLFISECHQNHQLNIVILNHFAYYEIFCEIFFFSSQISLKLVSKENRNAARTLTEMKHNLFTLIFFCQHKKMFLTFVKLLNINLDDRSLICRV